MRVLWLANIASPYSVDFFNELGKLCQLTVLFERKNAANRDTSWHNFDIAHFEGIFLRGIKYSSDKAICFSVSKYINKRYDVIVVSNMATITGMIAVAVARLRSINYIIQGDGAFKKNGQGFKEKIKKYIISNSSFNLSTGQAHDEYYRFYGSNEENIGRIPFTSIFKKDILDSSLSHEQKNSYRQKLGITGETVIVSVGQFIQRKGFDILIKAASRIKSPTEIYIIGGTPTQEYIDLVDSLEVENVHFIGFVDHSKLYDYFKAADLFVFPTREDIWGLVVNEAMATGLPVITTTGCIAGLELIENDINGFLTNPGDENALVEAINIALNKDLKLMGDNSLLKIQSYTFENVAKKHVEWFDYYLKMRGKK